MALPFGIPIVGISSLEGLAYNIKVNKNKYICSLIDARNNQVYCGIFDNKYNLVLDYLADDINKILEKINKYSDIIFVGNGFEKNKEAFNSLKKYNISKDNLLHASNIGLFRI